ncbi:MAG: ParB/RepB/Spo0J family partition protein [Gemmatimonadaceae bacterium]
MAAPAEREGETHREVEISNIRPNPYQPRREFSPAELAELQESMKSNGLLQPIAVRAVEGGYELIAGERRLRAATALGWITIPAITRQLENREMLTLALVENLQRTDLNPIEEADGYQRLIDEFSLTQQQVASAVGKDRSTVANLLRLRQLPTSVREMVRNGKLSVGHARALLSLPSEFDITEVAAQVVADGLTVRDVERLARPSGASSPPQSNATGLKPEAAQGVQSAEARRVVDLLRRRLQTDVAIVANARAEGEIKIRFFSADDLDRVLTLILGSDSQLG